jgi:hypothetical protein
MTKIASITYIVINSSRCINGKGAALGGKQLAYYKQPQCRSIVSLNTKHLHPIDNTIIESPDKVARSRNGYGKG